jgi:ribonuclease HII
MIGDIDLDYENKGFKVIGIDEAGRGPLCGPVVVAAVSLFNKVVGLNDSKKLNSKQRESLVPQIIKNSMWQIYAVSPKIIDEKNILGATLFGMEKTAKKLLKNFYNQKTVVLIDGNKITKRLENEIALIKGDSRSINIAAASILAKVHRDKIMIRLDKIYPQYNFKTHKGYPTKEHYEMIEKFGVLPIHRKSFNLYKVKQLNLF